MLRAVVRVVLSGCSCLYSYPCAGFGRGPASGLVLPGMVIRKARPGRPGLGGRRVGLGFGDDGGGLGQVAE